MPRRNASTTPPSTQKGPPEPTGFVHRVVPAAGSNPPSTTAAPSVFGAASPKRKRLPPTTSATLDPGAVVIRKGVPIPPNRRNASASIYSALMDRMAKGDMVELPHRNAKSLYSWANTNRIKAITRRLTDETSGVWRLS